MVSYLIVKSLFGVFTNKFKKDLFTEEFIMREENFHEESVEFSSII